MSYVIVCEIFRKEFIILFVEIDEVHINLREGLSLNDFERYVVMRNMHRTEETAEGRQHVPHRDGKLRR